MLKKSTFTSIELLFIIDIIAIMAAILFPVFAQAREQASVNPEQPFCPDRLTAKQVDSLNRILWHSIKGSETPYPAPVHRALLQASGSSSLNEEQEEGE